MADSALPLQPRLLFAFDSVVSQVFESVDDGNPRFLASRLAEAEFELLSQIAELKRRYPQQRNSRQTLCRLPAELLIRSLHFLSISDQLLITRVCQHLRGHVMDTPGLWTHVDHIRNPDALSFVLERAKDLPVDIIGLNVTGRNDVRFEVLAAHMRHIRTLCLGFDLIGREFRMRKPGRAYTAFNMAAPLLERISMHSPRAVRPDDLLQVFCYFGIPATTMPRLSSLQLHGVELDNEFFRQIQSLRSFSFSGREDTGFFGSAVPEHVSQILHNLTTINLELAGWSQAEAFSVLGPAVQRISIRWTKPGFYVPRDSIPSRAGWSSIRAVHVAHVRSSTDIQSAVLLPSTAYSIPRTTAPYRSISIRTSGSPDIRVHAQAIDSQGRERVLCGLHPATVTRMVAQLSGHELSTITISTTAVVHGVLSSVHCPALICLRIVLDTDDITWFNVLARDMLSISTLERLEFSREPAFTWSTAIIMSVLASCVATGNQIHEVAFRGFDPGAQFVTSAKIFAQVVSIHREWSEPEIERIWFMEAPFEWF